MRRLARHAGLWLLWATVLFWLWMLVVGEWNDYELVAAAAAAFVGATFAEIVRSVDGADAIVPLRRLPALLNALMMVFVDFGILTLVLARSLARRRIARGTFVVRESSVTRRGPKGRGDRAWTTLLANLSPNAYVIAIQDEGRTVLLHDLVRNRKSEEPA